MPDYEANTEDSESGEKDYGQVHFSWSFSEFPRYNRDRGWYIKAGLVVIALLFFSLFDPQISLMKPHLQFGGPNYLFAVLVILTSLIILLFHRSEHSVEFQIAEDGIVVNSKFFDYKDIKNFYIIYEPPEVKTLYFEPKSLFNPRIPIHLDDQNPVEIREILKQYLAEDLERDNEPLSDQFSRIFKL